DGALARVAQLGGLDHAQTAAAALDAQPRGEVLDTARVVARARDAQLDLVHALARREGGARAEGEVVGADADEVRDLGRARDAVEGEGAARVRDGAAEARVAARRDRVEHDREPADLAG